MMKSLIYLITCVFTIVFPTIVHATSNEKFIDSFEHDITGDQQREYIRLTGIPITNNSSYFQKVTLSIEVSLQNKKNLPLQPGYNPTLQLIDLNHDKTLEIFYRIAKDKNNLTFDYYLFSFLHNQLIEIELPFYKYLKGYFIDNFGAILTYDSPAKQIFFSVDHNKTNYIEDKLYDSRGNLLKKNFPLKFTLNKLTPVYMEGKNKNGLKSHLTISGLHKQDVLGYIETIWLFHNGDWIIKHNKFLLENKLLL